MTKIVNSLSAKMEIGSPMACMYLLGNPDHYTNKKFALFFWQGYLQEVVNGIGYPRVFLAVPVPVPAVPTGTKPAGFTRPKRLLGQAKRSRIDGDMIKTVN